MHPHKWLVNGSKGRNLLHFCPQLPLMVCRHRPYLMKISWWSVYRRQWILHLQELLQDKHARLQFCRIRNLSLWLQVNFLKSLNEEVIRVQVCNFSQSSLPLLPPFHPSNLYVCQVTLKRSFSLTFWNSSWKALHPLTLWLQESFLNRLRCLILDRIFHHHQLFF